MAIRLATLAMVPVKSVYRLVNPVSKGEPLCADATIGSETTTKMTAATNWLRRLPGRRCGVGDLRVMLDGNRANIGHLQRPDLGRDMPQLCLGMTIYVQLR